MKDIIFIMNSDTPSLPLEVHPEPPNFLYHYTSLVAAKQIIGEGKLWASNLHFLNDASEYAYPIESIRSRLIELTKTSSYNAGQQKVLSNLLDQPLHFDQYIASFTEESDDLTQWRGYSPYGQGARIAFRGAALHKWRSAKLEPAGAHSARLLMPVQYIKAASFNSFDDVLRRSSAAKAHAMITNFAPFFKDSVFKSEKEWRAMAEQNVSSLMPDNLKFRLGQSTLVPYITIDLKELGDDAVADVMIGPSPNIKLSVKAFQLFLKSIGSRATVSGSSVPYRYV